MDAARSLFPNAPEPWIDLSTGINPHAYPQLDLPAYAFTRLPEPERAVQLRCRAAEYYGAPSVAHVAAAPGTQVLLPRIASLVSPGRACILGPTYAEHARAAALAGHEVVHTSHFEELFESDLAVVVNPNNPDGRVVGRARLLGLARHLRGKGGLLVVDEAFMDVGPIRESLAGDVADCGAVVLRSFGKFFGLAGARLGFALASQGVAESLNDELGPWAVSGPALEYGVAALADRHWQATARGRLAREAAALDQLLQRHGVRVVGGTSLFRFVLSPHAGRIFDALGSAGIVVRRFRDLPEALRFGLPAGDEEAERLASALAVCQQHEAS